eukprot:g2055.t1
MASNADVIAADTWLAVLELLDVRSQGRCAAAGRLLFTLVQEARAAPFMLTDVCVGDAGLARLTSRLPGAPSVGFAFFTEAVDARLMSTLRRDLPLGMDLIGARVSRGGAAATVLDDELSLSACDAHDSLALTLGHFPEARTQSFVLTREEMARDELPAALPLGAAWRVYVLLCAHSPHLQALTERIQLASPGAAVIGGIVAGDIVCMGRGEAHVAGQCVAGLAFAGNAPLTALVSRGTKLVSPCCFEMADAAV